jgi:hypothetical protein
MSENNGVIRIGRKGVKKFAFGDGPPFDVDIVVVFQEWVAIDESFRPIKPNENGERLIPTDQMPAYHRAAVEFVERIGADGAPGSGTGRSLGINPAEALDFIARLREQYDELAVFFRPKLRDEPDLPDSLEAGLRFSEEAS